MQKFLVRGVFLVLLLSAAESWALPPCPGSTSVLWTNCYGTYIYGPNSEFAGDKYVGEVKDYKWHGMAPIPVPMEINTSVNGGMANGTGKAPIPIPMGALRKVSGGAISFSMHKKSPQGRLLPS